MSALIFVLVCILIQLSAPDALAAAPSARHGVSDLIPVPGSELLVSTSRVTSFKAAATDTFYLYGGPGSLLGKFQAADGLTPDMQGWEGFDGTESETIWHRSDYLMEGLNGHGAGNHGMWAGLEAEEVNGWTTAPGYGNDWNAMLEWRHAVSDVSIGQIVALSFVFNYDVESGFDFFHIEYDSAGSVLPLLSLTGTERDGGGELASISFPTGNETRSIQYDANGYATGNTEIVLRLRVTSDGGWSDEDGAYPSDGAARVDDILVSHADGGSFDDFEGVGPHNWVPTKAGFAGDFAAVFARVEGLDPCRKNISPVLGFIDDGNGPYNVGYEGPGTGGQTSVSGGYGLPGGWVVNYNGGLLAGGPFAQGAGIESHAISPPIDWDLSGAADDGPRVVGANFRFSAYEDLSILNGIFRTWDVRSRTSTASNWGAWNSRGFVYYNDAPSRWNRLDQFVGDLLDPAVAQVQMRLAVRDLAAIFAFPGTNATPSPLFDAVSFLKYEVAGPSIVLAEHNLFQDSFSQGGQTDVSTMEFRDLMDVRIDAAADVSTGGSVISGDSLVVKVTSIIPTIALSDSLNQIRLHYSLNMNPFFEPAIRANAPVSSVGTGLRGWDQHEGVVLASQSTNPYGGSTPQPDTYFFDLPDVDFMYPGDILEYYIEAEDDGGGISTMPSDVSGYDDPSQRFNSKFRMRALPSLSSAGGEQPRILVWNGGGLDQEEDVILLALAQNGLVVGEHVDIYSSQVPNFQQENGIGSIGAHGATPEQLAGYDCIVHDAGSSPGGIFSGRNGYEKTNDIDILKAWFEQDADRSIVHLGDNVASHLANSSAVVFGEYLIDVLGTSPLANDVASEIGGQSAPVVAPTIDGANLGFVSEFVAYGGCLELNRFDSLLPIGSAVQSHAFHLSGSSGTYAPAASVSWERLDTNANRKFSMIFPYGLGSVQTRLSKLGESASSVLLGEILDIVGDRVASIPVAVPARPAQYLRVAENSPNPFNPATVLRLRLGREAVGSIRIFNLRGELVRELVAGRFEAGDNEVVWRGLDDRGNSVASGVYLVEYEVDGLREHQKVALVR